MVWSTESLCPMLCCLSLIIKKKTKKQNSVLCPNMTCHFCTKWTGHRTPVHHMTWSINPKKVCPLHFCDIVLCWNFTSWEHKNLSAIIGRFFQIVGHVCFSMNSFLVILGAINTQLVTYKKYNLQPSNQSSAAGSADQEQVRAVWVSPAKKNLLCSDGQVRTSQSEECWACHSSCASNIVQIVMWTEQKKMAGRLLFYDLLTINITPLNLAARIKKLSGLHWTRGPQISHVWTKSLCMLSLFVTLSCTVDCREIATHRSFTKRSDCNRECVFILPVLDRAF